ncbi:MAG: putative PEP-binding protein, partial [Candidatus Aenigmatarchaeota archaeon]
VHGYVTLDATQESGRVMKGKLRYKVIEHKYRKIPKTRTKVYLNLGEPDNALTASRLPVDGIGLARQEFIISEYIGEHPLAMIARGQGKLYEEKLSSAISKIVSAFYPRTVIVRLSDFKSNEYRNLLGGSKYEPSEANPMLGWRGASRFVSKAYRPAFILECRALARVAREFENMKVMVPFCRTIDEAKNVVALMRKNGLKNVDIGVMAEIPSDIILAEKFSKYFSFFSIGSNDLTQLVLGIDRDSQLLAKEFDERNEAVKDFIAEFIRVAHREKRTVGICGDAPSTHPDYAKFLVKNKIDSISVNPDVAVETKIKVARLEK